MKLFFICMLAFVWGAHATGYSQQQTVSLDLKQCDVNTLFQEIWKQTGLRFVYNEKDIQAIRPLDISVENQSVEKLLEKIFRDTPCQASFESDVIYITLRPATPQRQVEMVKLSGTVKDHKGIPLCKTGGMTWCWWKTKSNCKMSWSSVTELNQSAT